MIEEATATSVRKTITVEASREHAFEVFTAGFAGWWPSDTHYIGDQQPETVVIEPREGGRCYERAADGTECDWGKVVAWEPPARLIIGWQLNADWKYDPDFLTEVEVVFVDEGENRTRVELEHRDLDRYGAKQAEITASIDSDEGWAGLLRRFAAAASA